MWTCEVKEDCDMKRAITILIAVTVALAMAGVAFAQESAAAGTGITMEKAKSIALKDAKLKKSKVRAMKAEYDDGVFEVEFRKKKNKAKYEYDISSAGRILKKSIDYRYKHIYSTKRIGKAKAQKKAAKYAKVKLSRVKKGTCRYEYDDGEGTYTVKFRKGKYRYEVELLAPTGKVIEYTKKYRK